MVQKPSGALFCFSVFVLSVQLRQGKHVIAELSLPSSCDWFMG